MWIKSQDGNLLADMNLFEIRKVKNKDSTLKWNLIGAAQNNELMIIGTYTTEEKARKVLSIIQDLICTHQIEINSRDSYMLGRPVLVTTVFEIPKDLAEEKERFRGVVKCVK